MTDTYQLVELPPGEGLDGPYRWLHEGLAAVSRADVLTTYGAPELVRSAEEYSVLLADTTRYEHRRAVMVPTAAPTTVVAHASVDLPLADNQDVAEFGLLVDANYRSCGLGARLYDWAETVARKARRCEWVGWLDVPPVSPTTTLVVGLGAARVPADLAGWRFATRRGWAFRGFVHVFRLDLTSASLPQAPCPPAVRLETWTDGVPPQWRASYADLMAQDGNLLGGIGPAEGEWDEQRVGDEADTIAAMGRTELIIAAITVPASELVGVADFDCAAPPDHHAQGGVRVVPAGRRPPGLVLALTSHGLCELRRRRPDLRSVFTWTTGNDAELTMALVDLGFSEIGGSAILWLDKP